MLSNSFPPQTLLWSLLCAGCTAEKREKIWINSLCVTRSRFSSCNPHKAQTKRFKYCWVLGTVLISPRLTLGSPRWTRHGGIWLGSEHDTAESDSMMNKTQRNLTPRWTRHGGIWLRGEQDTAEFDSAVNKTQGNLTPWWTRHDRIWLCGEQDTAESDSGVNKTRQNVTPRWTRHGRMWLRGEQDTAESDSAVNKTWGNLTPRCQYASYCTVSVKKNVDVSAQEARAAF